MLQAKSRCCPRNPLGTAPRHARPDTPREGGKFRVCQRLMGPLHPIIGPRDRPIRQQRGVSAVHAAPETTPSPILRPHDQTCLSRIPLDVSAE